MSLSRRADDGVVIQCRPESGGFAFVNSVVAGGTPPITDESGRWKMCRRNRQTSETQLVRSSASTLT
jgi:hypothetical protein